MRIVKIYHEEGIWLLIILRISFGILESTSLSIARWVLTYPTSELISREWDSNPSWLWERPQWPLILILMDFFTAYRRLLLFVTHLSSHSFNPHFNISIFLYDGPIVWMVVVPHWVHLITHNGWMIYGFVICSPSSLSAKISRNTYANVHISKLSCN